MHIKKTALLFVSIILLLIQCSPKGEKKELNKVSSEKKQEFSDEATDALVIKGLSLGMDYSKATEQVLKLFKDAGFDKEITTQIKNDNTEICVNEYLSEQVLICIDVWKDEDNRTSRIEMSTDATNKFFNAADMSAEDFVREFAKNYNLPEMKPRKDEIVGFTYWKYESTNGWYVSINDAKYIKIEKIS